MLTAAIILWRMQRNSLWSFLLNGQIPQSFNPTVPCCWAPWFLKRQRLYLSLRILLISRELHSVSSFLQPGSSSFPLISLPHSLCSLFLSHFFYRISLFHLWPFLFIGSLIFLALTLLSAERSSSKLLHVSTFPCLTFLICFFASASGSLKNIKTSLSPSFHFLSLSGLYVIPFSLSMSLSALQIIQLGSLPGNSKTFTRQVALIDKDPMCACGSAWVCVYTSRSARLCLCVSPYVHMFFLCLHSWVCAWKKEREHWERALIPLHFSPGGICYLIRIPVFIKLRCSVRGCWGNLHTYTYTFSPSQHPSSQHHSQQPSSILYRKHINTHKYHKHPCLFSYTSSLRRLLKALLSWGGVAGTHIDLRCEREGKKGRRHNNRHYQQTVTLPSLVIQRPEDLMFSLRDTLTLSAAKLGLRLGIQRTAAAKFCRVGSQSKWRKHNVSKDV